MRARVLALLVCATLAAALASCGGDNHGAEPAAPDAPSGGPSTVIPRSSTPGSGDGTEATGIASVDQAIAIALSADGAALIEALDYTRIACTANPRGIGGPPICRRRGDRRRGHRGAAHGGCASRSMPDLTRSRRTYSRSI